MRTKVYVTVLFVVSLLVAVMAVLGRLVLNLYT